MFGSWRSIRKQPHQLTRADLEKFPLWQGCLDEEGRPGQDESTMRPWRSRAPVSYPDFYGMVASDFITPRGVRWLGTIEPKLPNEPVWDHDPCIWLDRPAREIAPDPLLDGYTPLIFDRSIRFSLPLRSYLSDAAAQALITLVYRVLGVAAPELFPLTIRPRHAIRDFRPELVLPGFGRHADSRDHYEIMT